ncbi:hypothetical protein [Paraburkholderia sp. 40]|uniref:hypothetical protein n=1 Tax=unclassified Paraburkholderia TaxID=2615204 RepID=UPI003D1E2F1E
MDKKSMAPTPDVSVSVDACLSTLLKRFPEIALSVVQNLMALAEADTSGEAPVVTIPANCLLGRTSDESNRKRRNRRPAARIERLCDRANEHAVEL